MSALSERLRSRAESYRSGGPSSEHTAALLDEAAVAIDEAEFLVSRLIDFESDVTDTGHGAVAREYYGHVSPAVSRVRSAIAKAEGRS